MVGTANDLNISEPGYVSHNGSGVFHGRTFQAGTGISLTNADGISGNTTISSTASLTDLHAPRFIVASSTGGTGANYTSIASAIAAAQGTGINSTIFLQPGTYSENVSLVPGINLCAFTCDAFTPNVIISGTLTLTAAGTVSISGIRLQTNSAALLAVTGSAASIVDLHDCFINCTNNTGITFSATNTSAAINITNCFGDIGTTGISYFTNTSTGTMRYRNCRLNNTGLSTTASTVSAGSLIINHSQVNFPITISGTGGIGCGWNDFDSSALNTTALTLGGSGNLGINYSTIESGSASAVSIGGTAQMIHCNVNSSNTNTITGAGQLNYAFISFTGSSSGVNTTTLNPLATLI